jgi:hypothetical protein
VDAPRPPMHCLLELKRLCSYVIHRGRQTGVACPKNPTSLMIVRGIRPTLPE